MLNQTHAKVPVDIVEFKGLNQAETMRKQSEVEAAIQAEKRRSGKGTFLHVYCNGRAALWEKELQIKYLGEKAFYPLEAKLKMLGGEQNALVWAVFDCDRNLRVDPNLPGVDTTQS